MEAKKAMQAIIVSNSQKAANIRAMLQASKITATCSSNPDHALIHLRANGAATGKSTDVIIYDVACGEDVKDFRTMALADQPEVKVIAFGPKRPLYGPRRGADIGAHGADYYLNEPFVAGELISVIRSIVPKALTA